MARPLGTSARTIRSAPLLLLDLETNEGVTGHAYIFCYMPPAISMIARILDESLTVVKGERVAPQEISAKLERHFRLIGAAGIISMALAGVDVACWDALAVAAGLPLVKFLGASSKPVPAYNSNGLGLMPTDALADETDALLEGGFRGVKLRLGYSTLDEDLAALQAVRERSPQGVELMVDYNQALGLDEALRRCRALDGEGLGWIEEPIRQDDYLGCAHLAQEFSTPIQIGENFAGPQAMSTALALNAADLMMPDLCRIGGVSGWQQAASLAAGKAIPLSSHLFPECSVHLLAASPTRHWLEYVDWASPILAEPLRVVDGKATPPDRSGTGVSWNTEAVARYKIE